MRTVAVMLMALAAYGAPRDESGIVDRTLHDLRRASWNGRLDGHERNHFNSASKELEKFQDRWRDGRFDTGRLDKAIDSLRHLANAIASIHATAASWRATWRPFATSGRAAATGDRTRAAARVGRDKTRYTSAEERSSGDESPDGGPGVGHRAARWSAARGEPRGRRRLWRAAAERSLRAEPQRSHARTTPTPSCRASRSRRRNRSARTASRISPARNSPRRSRSTSASRTQRASGTGGSSRRKRRNRRKRRLGKRP